VVLSDLTVLHDLRARLAGELLCIRLLVADLERGVLDRRAEGFLGGSAARSGQRKILNEDRNRSTWSERPLRGGEFARL
jgi:hypothetical protein